MLMLNQQKKISVGRWVYVSCGQPFTGQVQVCLEKENIFTKQISYEYIVISDKDGERYRCEVGKDGCKIISQILKPRAKKNKAASKDATITLHKR